MEREQPFKRELPCNLPRAGVIFDADINKPSASWQEGINNRWAELVQEGADLHAVQAFPPNLDH